MRLAHPVSGHGKRDHFDALFAQRRDLVTRRRAAYLALGRFAIVNLARLLGKRRPDVFRIVDDVLDHLGHQVAADVGVLLLARRCGIRARRALLGHAPDVRGMRQPSHVRVAAQRAGNELAPDLALVVLVRVEPALEAMVVGAAQIKDDHDFPDYAPKWWARPDSNRYGLRRGILSALCIPIPPLARPRYGAARIINGGGGRNRT